MRVEWMYRASLRIYPADYRVRFGSEMRAAFADAERAARRCDGRAYLGLLASEAWSVIAGAGREWIVKLVADPVVRARVLPDCRLMRPVGVTRAEWAAGLDDGC